MLLTWFSPRTSLSKHLVPNKTLVGEEAVSPILKVFGRIATGGLFSTSQVHSGGLLKCLMV